MIGKNNSYLFEVKKGTKVESYSIKKFKVGTASVVIGASIFFGAGAVQAAEEVSNSTIVDNTTNEAGKAEAVPKAEAKPVVETTKENVAAAVAEKVGAETPKAEVKKEILKASIATLEEKLKSAQDADKAAVEAAKEALETAKAVLANEEATQAEVDAQAQAVQALSQVVTEAKTQAFDKKLEEKKEAEQKAKEATATKEEKEVAAAKKELTQVASEAEVTNTLAKTELSKKDLKVEAKPAVQAAVVKNEEALKVAKELLGNDKATTEQIAKSLAELSNSIKAVYTQLENAGVKRSGKFDVSLAETEAESLQDASTETGKKWLADHGYTSLTDIPIKTKERNGAEIKNLNGQIQWLDFGDKKAWTKLKENGQLQVGSVYEKEIIPGYTVKLTVKELKPFDATDVYKRRVAGTVYQNSYKPNGENRVDANNGKPTVTGIGGLPQGDWSETKKSGLDTGKAKTTIGGVGADGVGRDATVAGVKFTIEAKYNGKLIKPSIVMTSGENIGDKETEIYTTNGTPWDLLALIGHGQTKHYLPLNNFNRLFDLRSMERLGDKAFVDALAAGKFATPDSATAGLGSQVFGGYTHMLGRATPIVTSSNVTEVGFYLLTTGQQSSMLGIKISDYGDLPESYGEVEHYLKTKTLDSVTGAEKQIQQPYLGTVKADPESTPGRNISGENSDDETDYADEGVDQLMPSDFIVRNKATGLSAIRPILGPNNTHKIKIKASANGNENFNGPLEKAYVRGFIDFNNNGKFDQGEESDIKEVTDNNQIVELTFHNTHVIDENNDIIKFRVRIATDRTQVENPTGIAYSGEVEDNQVQVTNPPRGDYEETTGKQGDKQRISFEYISHNKGDEPGDLGSKNGSVTFNSYGKIDYTQERNSITAETTKTAQGGVRIVNETGQLVTNLNVPGQGTYEVSDTGVTFTPDPAFVGKASGVVLRAVDANGQSTGWEAVTDGDVLTNTNNGGHSAGNIKSMDAVYVPIVEPKEMTGHSKETTGLQGKEQKGIPLFKVNAGREAERIVSPSTQYIAKLVDPKSGSIINETSITVENEGTYTIVPETGEVKFQPLLSFKGTAGGVTVELTGPVGFDKDGVPSLSTARAKYIPTVIAVSPTAEAATSTGIQGEVQTGKPTFKKGHEEVPIKENSIKLLNSDGDEVTETPALGEGNKEVGKYTVDSSTGIVTFTPTDKSYIGTVVPARVQAKDINETKVETKYTPSIVGVKPQASPATSTGIQGEIQEGTVTFTGGKAVIGDVEKSVPIKVGSSKLIGSDGTEVTEVPAYANDGVKQDGVKQVGTYSITPGTNKVIFTPTDKTYTGTVLPVDVQAEDENGTKVRTTYTPHILGVSPTAKPAVSKDIQGKEQTKEILFKPGKTTIDGIDKEVPLDSSTFKLLDENGQERDSVPAKSSDGLKEIGTYRINVVDNKPVVVFTPSDKTYTGEVREVTIQVKDTNGSKVTTTYTPTIVPVRPISTPVRSIGVQGLPQEGTPIFTAGKAMLNGKEVEVPLSTKAPKLVNPETGLPIDEKSIEVPNEGTYTIDENGKVTFTPEPQFTGVANGVEVQREDQNGTSVNAKYTPTVKGVTPTSKDVTSIGDKGEKQFGTPIFKAGSTTINNEKVEVPIDENVAPRLEGADEEGKVVIPKEGIYTIDATGKVTFTPEDDFVGVATGVTVKRVDKNGTLVTATYTPTVLGKTTTENVISEGAKNQPQSNTPLFKGDIDTTVPPTFEDKTKEKVISGQGTYTINDEGVVTFTPEKDYVGTATAVEVVRKDKNGRTIKATYTPTVRPETKYVTVENNGKETELIPTKDGKYPEEKIEGYRVIKTETDEKGNTKHIYEKVNTFFKDKEGNEIPKYPSEPGTVDKKDIPEYRFVESKKLPNGDTEHVYEKVNTFFKDKEGNEIPKYPSEPGTVDKKDIPEYRFVESKKLPNGDTEHVYEKVNTFFKDKEGNEIPKYPSEPGTVDKKDIPEYRFVESKKLPNGDTEHVYEKVNTFFKDKEGNEIPKYPSEPGTVDKKDIPEYRFVESKKLPNGDTEHVYEKVNTFFKDKEGNEIPKYPSEPGTVDKKDIPEYRFVESKKLPNGDTEHVYEKVNTFFKDKEGNEIPKYPSEPGTVDKKDIPEYRFVESKKLPNGDTEHVYEKVTTSFKDKEGKEIPGNPTEEGTIPKKDIPEYRFVESKKLPNGDTEHVYEKVNTVFKDKDGNVIPGTTTEEGTTPKKDIPGYRFVETKKLPNGDTEHVYEKVTTSFKDKEGKEIPGNPTEEGTTPKKDIPGYKFVETKKLPNGDTEHVYEKVTTSFKDKEGKEIPGNPTEEGITPKKDIPGYKFVETKKLPNGDTEHVYEKVTTSFKDKEGKEIPGNPTEEGTTPKKEIPGYRFVETKTLPNGDTEHVYEKVNTFFKDKEGNKIPKYPSEPGTVDKKDIPEYRFVESKKLPNGDTEHVYEKVTTSFKDKEGKEIPGNPTEEGTTPKKDIPGYRFVETKRLPNGDTEHVYEKVTTSFKDKEGKEIPGNPTEEGTTPKKDIPGYKFVETKKLPNGDTEHVYEKVNTVFKDKDGNVIPGTTTEEGTTPKKDIPGYRFVETKKLPNGDTEHVYEKVTTSFKDKEGKEIPGNPTEEGTTPKKDIPGYRFVETKTLPNGDTEHVYEKVTTPTPSVEKPKGLIRDTEGNVIPGFEFDMLSPVLDIPEYQYIETVTEKDGTVKHIYRAKQTIHRDKDGNLIPNVPAKEKGLKGRRNIPGYRLVETKTLPNGDIEHVYEKVTTPTPATVITTWTDENGNPLKPSENGAKGEGIFEGYEFVRTVVDENGNVRHIFRKVTAATPKAQVKRLANTGSETANTVLAGFGVLLAGIAAAIRKRKKED